MDKETRELFLDDYIRQLDEDRQSHAEMLGIYPVTIEDVRKAQRLSEEDKNQ